MTLIREVKVTLGHLNCAKRKLFLSHSKWGLDICMVNDNNRSVRLCIGQAHKQVAIIS